MNEERPIEKLLRRAAKKRDATAGAPLELHPATRRLLQGEVARQFPKAGAAEPSNLSRIWELLARRWIYAVGLLVILGVLAVAVGPTLFKPKSQFQLAQSSPGAASDKLTLAKNASPEPAPLAIPTGLAESDSARNLNAKREAPLQSIVAPLNPAPAAPAARVDQKISSRREFNNAPAKFADVAGSSETIQLDRAKERKAESGSPEFAAEERPAATAALAGSSQPEPARSVNGVAGNENRNATRLGVSLAAENVPKPDSADLKRLDYLGDLKATKSPAAPAAQLTKDTTSKAFVARYGGAENNQLSLNSQAYANVSQESSLARKKKAQDANPSSPVLANFKIEQQGRELKVIDADGSTYHGVVDAEATLNLQLADRQQQKIIRQDKLQSNSGQMANALAGNKSQSLDFYSYRVEGTNRTLNQNVVFTWNFIETNALAISQFKTEPNGLKNDAAKQSLPFPALLQNSLINGRAQFDGGKEIEVNAVPLPP